MRIHFSFHGRSVTLLLVLVGVLPALLAAGSADPKDEAAVAGKVLRPGKPAEHGIKEADLESLRTILKKAVDDKTLPGVSLLLVHKGEVIFKEAYGDLKVDQPARIASDTKPIVASMVLIVVEQGKLSLDDSITKHIPEFKGTRAERATVRQLLSHTAGIPGFYPGGRPTSGTLADLARLIASKSALREPGTFSYSGVSIDLACRCAEAAAGKPFEDLIHQHLFDPLEMKNTRFTLAADPQTVSKEALARGEGRYVSGGGGLSATLDDLAVFYQMQLNSGSYGDKRILSAKAVAEMHTKQKDATNPRLAEASSGDYGLGFYLARPDRDGKPWTVHHGGALGTMGWADVDRELVGVFFSQAGLPRARPVIAEVQKKVREIVPPTVRVKFPEKARPKEKMPPEDPARKFLKGEALYADVKAYCDLGEHRTATREDLKTADWLADELTKAGLKTELLPFTVAQFFPEKVQLEVDGKAVEAFPL